jgi:hypothetical protein
MANSDVVGFIIMAFLIGFFTAIRLMLWIEKKEQHLTKRRIK